MSKIRFSLGIHDHQPVGNFDRILESAYADAYLPFLNVLAQYPDIKISFHASGILWDFFKQKHPEIIVLLEKLLKNRQVEFLCGAYYEPVLVMLRKESQIEQVMRHKEEMKSLFGVDARGFWLAERIWESSLVPVLASCGIDYVVVDDYHIKRSDRGAGKEYGYYITEDCGSSVAIVPISEKLRYMIPFYQVNEVLEYFKVLSSSKDPFVAMLDDGEKFGVWPGTKKWVYEETWLNDFFSMLSGNQDLIETVCPSEHISKNKPESLIYMPPASYMEMMEWSLPISVQNDMERGFSLQDGESPFKKGSIYMTGGYFRNFLIKYSESGMMHKKMYHVEDKLRAAGKKIPKKDYKKALGHLWQAQCNCPYWHGVFGGIYLPHLRDSVYTHLIECEKIISAGLKDTRRASASFTEKDYNLDGSPEWIFESEELNLYVMPHMGGAAFEIDHLPSSTNLMNHLSRREEMYHKQIRQSAGEEHSAEGAIQTIHHITETKEKGLEKLLVYDSSPRGSFADRLYVKEPALEELITNSSEALAPQGGGAYSADPAEKILRCGFGRSESGGALINLSKKFTLSGAEVAVDYILEKKASAADGVYLGVEMNFGMLAGRSSERFVSVPEEGIPFSHLDEEASHTGITGFSISDTWKKCSLTLSADRKFTLRRFPFYTVSNSESGIEKLYQGTCYIMLFETEFSSKGMFHVKIINKYEVVK